MKDRAEYTGDYSILVQLVKDYFKWFGCCGMTWRQIRAAQEKYVRKPAALAKKRNRKIFAYKHFRADKPVNPGLAYFYGIWANSSPASHQGRPWH